MKNIIEYYYELYPDSIIYKDNYYYFYEHGFKFVLQKYNGDIASVDKVYNISESLNIKNILIHNVILTKEGGLLIFINNNPYILLKVLINDKKIINLSEINYINSSSVYYNYSGKRSNWSDLWAIKNDYFESQISEMGEKYPLLCKYMNYYLGLSENAIMYFKNVNINNIRICACHKRIHFGTSINELYNPLNIIEDYYIRDIAEYIKDAFFKGVDVNSILNEFLMNNMVSYDEVCALYSRLLYPSYFFDLYDEIICNKKDLSIINPIIIKSEEYEVFLCNLYYLLVNKYKRYFPKIEWIIKKAYY